MKKNVKALLACVAALAVAGGGYAALKLTEEDSSSGGASSSASDKLTSEIHVPLTAFEAADVTLISIENENGSYEAVPAGSPAEDGTVEMTIKGFEKLDVNKNITSSILNSAKALSSETTVEENASDLDKYGLKEPRASFTVSSASDSKTVLIGNESPVSGETYCMVKGDNTVYTAATANLSVFLNDDTDYISNVILENPADDRKPIMNKLTIARNDLDYDIVIEYDKSTDDGTTSGTMATHFMTAPIFAYLDPEKSQDEVAGLFGLTASSVIAAYPDEAEIKGSGLDKPFCTVKMECGDNSSYELKLGNKLDTENGVYYAAMFTDKDIIYAIDAESICWDDVVPDDIISRMVFGTYVWDIGKLEIEAEGKTVKFAGKGSSKDDYEVTKDGQKCDRDRFQSFYSFLLKTSAEEFSIEEVPQGEPQATVYLETQNGETKQTVEFYKADGKKSLICVNGTPSFKCRTAFVDLLIENLSKFDSDEKFVVNW